MNFNKHNEGVKKWTADARIELRRNLSGLGVRSSGKLLASIRASAKQNRGVIDRVGFQFERYGVFVEKGVGRGWPISRVRGQSAAIMGGRSPKPWFNNTMESMVPKLADIVKDGMADEAMANIKIR
jgi:hypothetical protein